MSDICPQCNRPEGAGHGSKCVDPEWDSAVTFKPVRMTLSNNHGPIAEVEFKQGYWWEDALIRWVKYGINPGHFLSAVLSNDLFGAYGRADDFCKADMDLIVKFVYNQLPGDCWGSKERVSSWKGL